MITFSPDHLQEIAGRRFQRGQVEHALWVWFSEKNSEAPAAFRGRIKKLLDIDREPVVLAAGELPPAARFAFFDREPDGQGFESQFSPFDVFCIGIGLELLDLGFKQAEVVFLLRYVRDDLQRQFRAILKSPPAGRMQQEDDNRVFMAIGKVELVERTGSGASKPLMLKPAFARGEDAASELLGRLGYGTHRKVIILEIGNTAVLLCNHLNLAPVPRKGRPRKG